MASRGGWFAVVLLGVVPCSSWAQDFVSAAPGGPSGSPAFLLEHALPSEELPARGEANWTSWLGMPEVVTRSLAGGGAFGLLRFAAGVSRTGPSQAGWESGGAALGATTSVGGAGVRVLGRREAFADEPERRAASIELGAGAWAEAARHVRVWARAPQLWVDGQAPALARPLALGVSYAADGIAVWVERESPARPGVDAGVHAVGMTLVLSGAKAWVEAREGPLRGAVGLAAEFGWLGLSARIEAHPVLGDTVTLGVGWLSRGAR